MIERSIFTGTEKKAPLGIEINESEEKAHYCGDENSPVYAVGRLT